MRRNIELFTGDTYVLTLTHNFERDGKIMARDERKVYVKVKKINKFKLLPSSVELVVDAEYEG